MAAPEREGYFYIGSIGVDSGMLMVGDPLLMLPGRTDAYRNDDHADYEDVLEGMEETDFVAFGGGLRGDAVAVAFSAGYGDGVYTVFGKYDERGRIVEVVIDMQLLDYQKQVLGIADDTTK